MIEQLMCLLEFPSLSTVNFELYLIFFILHLIFFFAEIIELLFVEHCAHSFSFNVLKKMQIVTGFDFDKLSGVYNNETIFLW